MITSTYIRQGRSLLRRLWKSPALGLYLHWGLLLLGGFCLSAASLGGVCQPLVLGLVSALSGARALVVSLGGCIGYWLFWSNAGLQGQLWTLLGAVSSLLLGASALRRRVPLLMSALCALIVAAGGVIFQQFFADTTPIPQYLLRIAVATLSSRAADLALEKKDPIARWVCGGLCVLALAQIAPVPWLNSGCIAAGILACIGAFPAAALAGLGLDLAGVSPVPLTAVVCLVYLTRLLPLRRRWVTLLLPMGAYWAIMWLCGKWDLYPLPGLLLGCAIGQAYPAAQQLPQRRGQTGIAQVRLEMASGVLSQTQQLLLETPQADVDEASLISRCVERSCGSCPARRGCRERDSAAALSPKLLHQPLLDAHDLPFSCRKSGRLLGELHRCQEQLRAIRADRKRQAEYRSALLQQYQFLANFLQELSDSLPQKLLLRQPRYDVKVNVYANREKADNGDRCLWFAGPHCRYYVLLCDGMGTGIGAVEAGKATGNLLQQMLCAGFPAQHALRSINSLCALRNQAGLVTLDLLEISLDSGKASLYKWGAAPSYLLGRHSAEKIGTAAPPPGLSVADGRETVERLSLGRGQTLLMVSDGVGGEEVLRILASATQMPPGELAALLLERSAIDQQDDATVMAVRLVPNDL